MVDTSQTASCSVRRPLKAADKNKETANRHTLSVLSDAHGILGDSVGHLNYARARNRKRIGMLVCFTGRLHVAYYTGITG